MMRNPSAFATELKDALNGVLRSMVVTEDWIDFEAAFGDSAPRDPWEAVRRNGSLGPGIKIAQASDGRCRLQGEVVAVPRDRRAVILAGLRNSLGLDPGGEMPRDEIDLFAMIDQSAWTWREADGYRPAVVLDVPGEDREACMFWDDVGLRLIASLDVPDCPVATRTAVATFLLRATGATRLVRATLTDERPALEVAFLPTPTTRDVDDASAALSIAMRAIGLAVERLATDPALADAYLTRLRAEDDSRPPTTHHRHTGGIYHEVIGHE